MNRKKIFLTISILLLLVSCDFFEDNYSYEDFEFTFGNKTDQVLDATIIIAGKLNSEFIPIDSIKAEEIMIGIGHPRLLFWRKKIDGNLICTKLETFRLILVSFY